MKLILKLCTKGGAATAFTFVAGLIVSTKRCEPIVTMMAHPTDRFLASFFQKFSKDERGMKCGFLNCKRNSLLSKRYINYGITPEEFATWKIKNDFENGFNEATKFFGVDNIFHS